MLNVIDLEAAVHQGARDQLVTMTLLEVRLAAHESNSRLRAELDQLIDARKVSRSFGHAIVIRLAVSKVMFLSVWPSTNKIAHANVFDFSANERALQRFAIEVWRVAAIGLAASSDELLDIMKLEQVDKGINLSVAMA